jgi:hypothetical protein
MNNQLTAANLAGYGRGPDTTLVHMAPQEVAGLQALAMAHGGSLTINPQTGLPEAGFLSSILPMVAGFALGPAGFGLMGSLGAAATVGGLSALTSGSLSKGLVAGLGAYGGAEIGGGLEAMGARGAAEAAAGTVADQAGAETAMNAAVAAPTAPALSGWGATQAGFSKALSDPKALIGQLGGNMGALRTAGMAVAPMIADQGVQTVTKAPESPQYYRPMALNRQQTGGVRTPGAPATSEKNWFDDVWTNPQPIKTMAAGGTAAEDDPYYKLSGQSEDAYRYLMGLAPRSRAPVTSEPAPAAGSGSNFVMPRKPTAPVTAPDTGGGTGEGPGGTGGQDFGGGGGFKNTPDWGLADTIGKGLSRAGLTALGGYLQDRAYLGSSAPGGGVDPQTGLQGQGTKGQTGLYGDAAAGTGLSPVPGANPNAMTTPMSEEGAYTGAPTPAGLTAANTLAAEQALADAQNAPSTVTSSQSAANTLAAEQALADAQNAPSVTGIAGLAANQAEAEAQMDAAVNAAAPAAPAVSAADSDAGVSVAGGDTSDGGDGGDGGDSAATGGYLNRGHFQRHMAYGGIASLAGGGLGSLGGYSDGGRLLRGPGDGVSDSIPAIIGRGRQPARLADGEFVVPARIVSELGNGSTEAGARKLYAMMNRIQANRGKTVGKNRVAVNSRAERHLPA